MVVGAVAEVLEHVAAPGERRLADPVRALAAHLGVALGRAVHPLGHEVAADPRVGAVALGHPGGCVVRAARAEARRAHAGIARDRQDLLRFLQLREAAGEVVVAVIAQQALADGDRDVVRVERVFDGEEPVAALVLLADHDRLVRRPVEFLSDLHLDERALLLDDDHEVEPAREIDQLRLRQRPGAGDLEEAQAHVVGLHLVEAELVHGLADVEIALADRDDADLRVAAAGQDHLVEAVRPHEGQHGVALEVVEARLLLQEWIARPDVQPAGRHREIGRDLDLHPVDAAVHGSRGFDVVLHAFHGHPGAAEAREREAVETVIEQLLHPGRVQDRAHHVYEGEFGLVRDCGGFGRVVVAHQGEDAAISGGAGLVGVAEDIARAVDAGALAVPDAEDAVVLALAAHLGLLRTPEGGRGELLVQPWLEDDMRGVELLLGLVEIEVEPGDRGAAVAGDEARGVEARAAVALALHQEQPDDRLRTREKDPLLREVVLVVERYGVESYLGEAHDPVLHAPRGSSRRLPPVSFEYVSNADICSLDRQSTAMARAGSRWRSSRLYRAARRSWCRRW